MKIIKNTYCPNCKRNRRFENSPSGIGAGVVFGKIIVALLWSIIPVVGWILALVTIISIFTDKNGEGDLYCCHCGHKITLKKDWFGRYKDI